MKNIPNILSAMRVLMIPLFIWQYLKGNTFNASIILIISGFTDFLDGYLARKFSWQSQLGQVLDPAADKLTLISISVVLLISLKEYRAFFIILLAKDFIMMILGGFLLKKGVKIQGAKWFGKIATFLFYIVMIVLGIFSDYMSRNLIMGFLVLVTIVEIVSAFLYIPDYLNYKKSIVK